MKLPSIFLWLILLFPPVSVLSRTLMSELPSLAISSLFFYLLFKVKGEKFELFILGLIGTVGILFREPLLIVFAPFLFVLFFNYPNSRLPFISGIFLGIGLRLLLAKILFGDFLFYKDPEVLFGFDLFLTSITLYAFALLIFLPGGLWAIWKYKGAYAQALKISVCTTVVFFSLYQFNGLNCGLFEGLILGPRFFIPSLPLFIIAIAQYFEGTRFKKVYCFLPLVAILFFSSVQVYGKVFNKKQELIREATLPNTSKIIYTNWIAQASKVISKLDSRFTNFELKHWNNDEVLPLGSKLIEYTADSIFVKITGNPDEVILSSSIGYTSLTKQDVLNILQ